MVCQKCGSQSNGVDKFCGQCGARLGVDEGKALEGQDALKQAPKQAEEQGVEQIPEASLEQVLEGSLEQVAETASEEAKPEKKTLGFIVGIAAILVAVIVGFILFSGSNIADEMRTQLEELNSNSYSEIREWVEVDFEEYFEEYFDLRIEAEDTEGLLLEDGFLDEEDRFLRWRFTIDEESEELLIKLIYRTLPLSEQLERQLEELDPNSLGDIIEWLERTEAEHGEDIYTLVVWQENPGGTPISPDFVNMEYEDLFEGWTFDIQDGFRLSVRINMVFHDIRSFELGETFEFNGLEVTIDENIRWGVVDNERSFHFGMEYFRVPVTLTNISDVTIDAIFPRVYAPDGSRPQDWFGTGTFDDFTRIDEFPPDETIRGYFIIEFEGDGEYWIEFWNHPVTTEVIIHMDSSDFQEEREALLAAIEPDEEDSTLEEYLIRRWEFGVGDSLPVIGEAEIIEFREDGTLLIIEDGVERTATWELGESGGWEMLWLGTVVIDGIEFTAEADDFFLILLDDDFNGRGWIQGL